MFEIRIFILDMLKQILPVLGCTTLKESGKYTKLNTGSVFLPPG